jgi:hypothetical protein
MHSTTFLNGRSFRVSRLVAQQMCDIFAGGDFVGVINAPNMGLIQQANLVPHVLLAERVCPTRDEFLAFRSFSFFRLIPSLYL